MNKYGSTNRRKHRQCNSAGRLFTSSASAIALPIEHLNKHIVKVLIITISLCFLFVAILCAHNASATTSTLTLTVADSISLDIRPISSNGTFMSSSINSNNISVSTNNHTGYTLSIAASNNNESNALVYREGETVKGTISSITSPTTLANYNDETYAINNNLNNTWGFSASKYNSEDNTSSRYYYPGPTGNNTVILDATNNANASSANTYNLAIGARVTTNQPIGSYQNTFVITAIANAIPYTINYNANAGNDTITNMPDNESSSTYMEAITIASNRPMRDDYVFLGWCTTATNDDTCSGAKYLNNAEYLIDQTTTNTIDLYAIWAPTNKLYYKVASLVKLDANENEKTQDLSDMQAVITEPTTNNPRTDTSNSGVFLYDAEYYGEASDASNDYPIYYYRGQLDQTFTSSDSYGGIPSTGDSYYYPNYVVLSSASNKSGLTTTDTCWRIVRTTGSGGVKMIYNGKWTGSTCANSSDAAAAGSAYFNRGDGYESTPFDDCNADNEYCGIKGFVTLAGYNYNSDYSADVTATSAISNSILFNNETPSNLRTKIETWYTNNSNLSIYGTNNKLETSAGWCDDRSNKVPPSISDTTMPYSTVWLGFNVRRRNLTIDSKLTLNCSDKTGYDILTTSNGLGAPIALLTLDEAALVGNGSAHLYDSPSTGPDVASKYSSNYSYKSFLRSGFAFWLLSPNDKISAGGVNIFYISSNGCFYSAQVYYSQRWRPVISISPETIIISGSGISTSPWIINS